VLDGAAEVEVAAAERIARSLRGAVARRGRAAVALAGGATPRGVYARLAEEPLRSRIPWSHIDLFWGDERCVPPDDVRSNYKMAFAALLSKVPLSRRAVHRIRGEVASPRAAALYERALRAHVAADARAAGRAAAGAATPRLDLVLLGLGADGHTASLFARTPALREERRLVVATTAPAAPRARVTLSLRAINAARAVIFVVVGSEKARAVARALAEAADRAPRRARQGAGGAGTPAPPPAALVRPRGGRVLWVLDRAAASLIASRRARRRA
jgi:6-phosphogluconolactonase